MKKNSFWGYLVLLTCLSAPLAPAQYQVHVEDVQRFWQAFDSVQKTSGKAQQMAIIQRLYVDKASRGLKKFMLLRGGNAEKWQDMIANGQEGLARKRPYIESVM
jgi:hypothetical protein